MSERRHLLFVSPRFLFPADSGGKIRTSQILRGMKGGRFAITLLSPAPSDWNTRFAAEIDSVCDRFVGWPEPERGPLFPLLRLAHLASPLPVPVATDRSEAGRQRVAAALAERPDVAVIDFPHAAVLAPLPLPVPSVMFTHNIEAEIFRRHALVAGDALRRWVWRDQLAKMERFERRVLAAFDTVIAVSARDAAHFQDAYGIADSQVIPTGVDLGFFTPQPDAGDARVVFCGSMDWIANVDAMTYMAEEIWPRILAEAPAARMVVVGRAPPSQLVERTKGLAWTFTGFVDDVRPHVGGAAAFVIPLRVGGGTRIKAFEGMAMGVPVVSTTIGVEGLPVTPDREYLRADSAAEFAAATVRLLRDADLRRRLAAAARAHVEAHASSVAVARAFEDICWRTMAAPRRSAA